MNINGKISLLYPCVAAQRWNLEHWPPFLLDIIPSGAARRFWMTRLSLGEGPHADWKILATGSGNPIGNSRVKEAAPPPVAEMSKGFRRSKIIERHEGFMDYVANAGGPTSGSSGAGGDAPKFLLSTDTQGLFHADAAIPDSNMVASFLVKFPRGKKLSDRQILKARLG